MRINGCRTWKVNWRPAVEEALADVVRLPCAPVEEAVERLVVPTSGDACSQEGLRYRVAFMILVALRKPGCARAGRSVSSTLKS